MWTLYAQTRTGYEDAKVRHDIKSMYDSCYKTKDGTISAAHSVRSAGAHGIFAAHSLSDTFHSFWKTGVVAGNHRDVSTLNQDGGGRVNPLMAISSVGSNQFNVHYGADPLAGFHLAEVFDVYQTKVAITNSLADLAKSQFHGWCRTFSSCIATSSVNIMHHCGDAVNFAHALQAIEGTSTLPSFTYFYSRPWSAGPLELPLDMVTRYDIIDTSNVMDHVGLLNLLIAVVPLLSTRHDPVLYTENLLQSAKESEKGLETLLHSNVTMSSLLFGVAPVGYLLGTMTDSTHIEQQINLRAGSGQGRQKQYRMRVPWRRPLHGDGMVSDSNLVPCRLNMDSHELASFFMQTYLSMFREAEDMSIRMEVMTRRMTQPLSGDLSFYSRLSLVALLTSAKRTISTDWQECISTLVSMIENDRSLIVSSNNLQELYMQLHLSGLWHTPMLEENPRKHTTYYGKPRSAGEPGVLGRSNLPGTVHIALVVPRSRLAVFTNRPVDQVGTPGLHLHVRNNAFDNAFFAVDTFFGRFESDDLDSASFVEDTRGWSGSSDMIITCRVPTWGLLVGRRQNLLVELVVTTSPSTWSYTMKLGVRNVVFGTSLDSKNVRILTQAPSTKPRAVPDTYFATAEPAQPTSATVVLKSDGTVQSIGVTKKFAPVSEESRALKDGGMVNFSQISPCIVAVSIGEMTNAIQFIFPYPVDGSACKMKIARKSSWIEIKAPPSNALQSGGFHLDPFPIVNQNTSSLAWGMGRVNPDLQSPVQISASTPTFLQLLFPMALSKRERSLANTKQNPGSVPPMILLKEVIGHMFSACAGFHATSPGKRITFFVVEHHQTRKILVADTLRHDRNTGSIFLDAFYMPPSAELVKHSKAMADKNLRSLVIDANEEEMELWQRLLPALVERCRSWEHATDCKRKTRPAAEPIICDCGIGKDAAHMPKDHKGMAEFAIRVAIPMISAVPYVESMIDEKIVSKMTDAMGSVSLNKKKDTTARAGCDHCGNDKPGLKVCSRCEKVKYCNHACRKAAWKTHKKVCKHW